MSDSPQLLVIGAQKCATTTLYEDLREHPDVLLLDKESSGLLRAADRPSYRAMFGGRVAVEGEVSTEYSMLPAFHAVERAASWAPQARIVYIVRNPLVRVISHHHHDFAHGLVGPDIDRAVHEHPSLIQNSRYATQIRPWIEAYGRERVHVIRFEDYVADRAGECARLCRFLGLEPHAFDTSRVANAADTKVVASGAWGRLSRSRAYRGLVRPLMSEPVRRRLMNRVLPPAPARPGPPLRGTLDYLVETLSPEVHQLAEMLGEPEWWDLRTSAGRLGRDVG